MAKEPKKTNSLGMDLTPSVFGTQGGSVGQEKPVGIKKTKSKTRGISLTIEEDNIEKLRRLAEAEDITASKYVNRWLKNL